MKKIKNESQLLTKALQVGRIYAIKRGFKDLKQETSMKHKVECIYRLLVQDNFIQPLAKDQENIVNMKHKLVLWVMRQLPKDDPLQRKPDISKAKALLEWSPKTKRKKGLLKTYEYFKTIGSDELIIKPKIFC